MASCSCRCCHCCCCCWHHRDSWECEPVGLTLPPLLLLLQIADPTTMNEQ